MMSLVPQLEPTYRNDFRDTGRTISLGKLCFTEEVGTVKSRHKITLRNKNEDLLPIDGFVDGKLVIKCSSKLTLVILVSLFLNRVTAVAALRNGYQGSFINEFKG